MSNIVPFWPLPAAVVVVTEKHWALAATAKAVAAQTGKRTKISCRMSTGGDAPLRPFAHFDAEFQTKMHDIMSDIKAAEEDVRKAKAAREAMV